MGRKPLGNIETKVRLPPGLPQRIDALVGGPKRRAKFMRDALVEAVEKAEHTIKPARLRAMPDQDKPAVPETPKALDAIVDKVLGYKPKATQPVKKPKGRANPAGKS